MDILDDELLDLWRLLNKHSVLYILVGGFATNLHGFNRVTADIDLWVKDTKENRANLRKVLKDLELGDFEEFETMNFLPGWSSILLNSGFELDIMTSMKGFSSNTFDDCFEYASTALIEEIPVKFLHINHLIEAKKASAREKDLIDIVELEKIKNSK